ncbi:MAG TPA: hypothetical protein VK908_07650 [Jiangellales bacterium]|nr:hypothetical protein [Jiangellales bacterium]
MSLYSSFLTLGPFIPLAVTAGAFGPWGRDDDEHWSYAFLWDVAMVLSVITGGIVSLLVLGEVVGKSTATRWIVIAGCLSLALLAVHMLGAIYSLHRSHRRDLAVKKTPASQ